MAVSFKLFLSALLVISPHFCRAAFNNPSDPRWCWYNSCVRNQDGRVCFKPSTENPIGQTTCNGGYAYNPAFQAVMDAHLSQSHGHSIAHYDYNTNTLLGDFNYPIPANTTVKLCLSGRTNDGGYQTWCMQANRDNDITDTRTFCWVRLGQSFVSDNCYIAMPPLTPNSGSTSSSSPVNEMPSVLVPTIFLVILGLAHY